MKKRKSNTKYYVDNKGVRRKIGSWAHVKNPSVREWARNKERDILAGVEKNEGAEGHVYAIYLGFGGMVKIGRTKNIPQRIKSLKAANPELRLLWSAWVKDTYAVEEELHKMFKSCRAEREVFRIQPSDIRRMDQLVSKIKESY